MMGTRNDSIALIDGDSIAYIVSNRAILGTAGIGFSAEESDGFIGDTSESNIVECPYKDEIVLVDTTILREAIQDLLNSIMKHTNTACTEIWLSTSSKTRDLFIETYGREPEPNFRFEVAKILRRGYKHNRQTELMPGVLECYKILVHHFGANIADGWEADDEVCFLKNESPDLYVLSAMDKDVLGQCPGTHYNYKQAKQVYTSKVDATYMKYWQAIVGDPIDGYSGVPGIGKVRVSKFINTDMSEVELWEGVVRAYASKGLGEEQALATIRLASMHQLVRQKGVVLLKLYTPPTAVGIYTGASND